MKRFRGILVTCETCGDEKKVYGFKGEDPPRVTCRSPKNDTYRAHSYQWKLPRAVPDEP